jgi:sec-independent protein translocase protein TatA
MLDGLASPSHWLILLVLFVVFFGYKKLPDASKSMARSLRIFKSEMKGFHEDETPANPATQNAAPQQLPAAPPPAPSPAAVPGPGPVAAAPPVPTVPVTDAAPVPSAAPAPPTAPAPMSPSPAEHVAAGDGAAPHA